MLTLALLINRAVFLIPTLQTTRTVGVGACIHIAFLFYLLSTFIVAFSSPHDDVRKVGQNFPTIESKSWVLTVGKVCTYRKKVLIIKWKHFLFLCWNFRFHSLEKEISKNYLFMGGFFEKLNKCNKWSDQSNFVINFFEFSL